MEKIIIKKQLIRVNNESFGFITPKALINSGVLKLNEQYKISIEEVDENGFGK